MNEEELIGQEIRGLHDTYIVEEHVARGTRSNIYKVVPRTSDVYKCAKILTFQVRDEDLKMLQREEKFLSRLNHPNIVRLHDTAVIGGFHCSIMEYFSDGSLADRFRAGPLNHNDLIHILEQAAAAIDYAHDNSVVHQDIKPANILLDGKRAALSDFGIARILGEQVLTAASDLMGTPAYMAPEQAYGNPPRKETDIYALGVVAFQALTGEVPYKGNSPMATLMAVVDRPVPNLRLINQDIPRSVNAVVRAALAKEPLHRYESATEFVQSLKLALRDPIASPVLPKRYEPPSAQQEALDALEEALRLAGDIDLTDENEATPPPPSAPPAPDVFDTLYDLSVDAQAYSSDALEFEKRLLLQETRTLRAGLVKASQLSVVIKIVALVLWWVSLLAGFGLTVIYSEQVSAALPIYVLATALLPLLFWLMEALWRWHGYDFQDRTEELTDLLSDAGFYHSLGSQNLSMFSFLFDPLGTHFRTRFAKILFSWQVMLLYLLQFIISLALSIYLIAA